ncbi:MAG: Na+/H+ antiporter subunit E, partial [Candidatus Puniceispirillaceae bacterium]
AGQVSWTILRRPGSVRPVMRATANTANREINQVIYANSITLTPGTVTMDIDEQASKDQFLVHALHPAFGEDVRSNDMDRRVTALEATNTRNSTGGA